MAKTDDVVVSPAKTDKRPRDGWFDTALLNEVEPKLASLTPADSQWVRKMVAKRFPADMADADRDLKPLDLQRLKDIQASLK